jgi:TolA-binding protein
LLASLLSALAAAEAGPLGVWTANGARLELTEKGGRIVGTLAAQGGPCPLPAGTELLSGTLLDDSLTAQVRLCLVAEKCGADPESAFAVLLVTRALTGGVHSKAPCAQEARTLVLRRPGATMAMKPPPAGRLAATPAPEVPRASTKEIAASVKIGQIPGRPVGEPEHPPGYDPRDARKKGTAQGEAEKLLIQGAALLQEGRFERARQAFQSAVQKDPQRAEAYNGVGVTFYARADLDEALAWYKRALEADPRFGDAFYNLACIYALQKQPQLAFRYLRLAALNHYADREAMERDPDLTALHGEPQWREILEQMQ